MTRVPGIDVSEHNGTPDFERVREAGYKFVFIKVNEGDRIDRQLSHNAYYAQKAGLLVGGYNFLTPRPGRTGAQEFDLFYNAARPVGLLRKGCLRPVVDVERTLFTGPLAGIKTRRYIKSWVKRCIERTGVHPIIYTAKWFYDDAIHARSSFNCKLWLAAYVSERQYRQYVPKGWNGHASFWQHTDQGKVYGVSGRCDLNLYLSSLSNLKKGHTLPHSV